MRIVDLERRLDENISKLSSFSFNRNYLSFQDLFSKAQLLGFNPTADLYGITSLFDGLKIVHDQFVSFYQDKESHPALDSIIKLSNQMYSGVRLAKFAFDRWNEYTELKSVSTQLPDLARRSKVNLSVSRPAFQFKASSTVRRDGYQKREEAQITQISKKNQSPKDILLLESYAHAYIALQCTKEYERFVNDLNLDYVHFSEIGSLLSQSSDQQYIAILEQKKDLNSARLNLLYILRSHYKTGNDHLQFR